ncbi:TPA: TIGR03757 family integrating conjugative element protein [Enterobacter hormaechei subsp. steigerwaltii]|nr:TIGR03757 family integrating conjugative element protein [Enterobacter hormaechei subsp. steigerwaltii]
MKRCLFLFPLYLLFISTATLAQTVIYTTARWPVEHPEPGVDVQLLENVDTLSQSVFPSLSASPAKAEAQARLRMQQPDWRTQEARLTRAYQALLDARTVGITKVPAVVFVDHFVVYGTTDVTLARQKLAEWRERHP